jgi:hypothetical protein
MADLKLRAQAFPDRPIPDELKSRYVPGSMAELFIRNCAAGGRLDEEGEEPRGMCAMAAESAADSHSTADAKEYFAERAALLSEIESARAVERIGLMHAGTFGLEPVYCLPSWVRGDVRARS